MPTTRLRIVLLAIVSVAALATTSSVTPVSACTGVPLLEEGEVPPDEVIFTGTAVKVVDPRLPFDPISSSADIMEWTFVIDGVVSGPTQPRLVVRSERSDASCGFGFQLGHRYRVVAAVRGDGLHVGSGSGTRELEPLAHPPAIEESTLGSITVPVIAAAIAGIGLVSVLAFRGERSVKPGED